MTDTLETSTPDPDPAAADEPAGEVVTDGWFGLAALLGGLLALGLFAGLSWVIIVVALVITIFMHELGHYATARWSGMKVTEFFIGFGPRVWSFRRGETEYGIKAVWLGAYVRIIGMNNLDEVDAEDEPRSFRQQSYPKRLLVLVAGSGMHFIMALVFLFVVLTVDGPAVDGTVAAEEVDEWSLATVSVDSAAEAAGLEPGDQLISVAGVERTTFADFGDLVTELGGTDVEIVFRRDGDEQTAVTTIGERLTAEGADGIVGLIERDRILAVDGLDGDEPPTYAEFSVFALDRLGVPLDITIVDARSGAPVVVEGAVVENLVDPGQGATGFFGISADYERQGLGALDAVGESFQLFGGIIKDVTLAFPRVFTQGLDGTFDGLRGDEAGLGGIDAVRELETRRLDTANPDENRILSIYGVARLGASATEDGLVDALTLLLFVNIFIGVFNLVPLLPLDGGHVAVATYERIRSFGGRRHYVDAAKLLPLTYAVVVLLLVIGGVALVRDIVDPVNFG